MSVLYPVRRFGFTLIELFVVIAVIGVLMALLVPAIQAARESSRRSQCANNLRQIGIAMQGYHATNGVLPKGGAGIASLTNPLARSIWTMSWGAALLPDVAKPDVYDAINQNHSYLDPANLTAGRFLVATYLCPSALKFDDFKPNGDTPSSTIKYARTDYGGNWGERALRCYPDTNCPNNYAGGAGEGRGVMMLGLERTVRVDDVTDGAGATIMIGEAPDGLHSIWNGHKNVFDQSAPLNNKAAKANGPVKWQSCAFPFRSNPGLFCDFGQEFHSYHSGGANFLFVDGSVRFIGDTIDLKVFAAALSRRGGEMGKDGLQ